MPVAQGLLQGSSIRKGCASHQQTRVPGRLTCSRRSPSSRLSLNARTQSPAPQQFARSARSCRRQLKQHKKDCSCPYLAVCGCRQTTVCGAGTAHPEEEQAGQGSHDSFSSNVSIPTTGMAKGLGSFGGATLERSKLDTKQEVKTQEPRVDNSGGGGNNGKNIFNGAIIRQSVQMGLFSSAQLVRFLSMDVRPNVTRAVTRTMPPAVSRGVVGRLMADPAFVQKMLVEQVISISSSLAWEARQRGENFTKELDLVAINTLQFSIGNRAASLVVKSAELCAVGSIAGAAMSGLSQLAVNLRQQRNPSFTPSVPVPDLAKSTAGMAPAPVAQAKRRKPVKSSKKKRGAGNKGFEMSAGVHPAAA
ncbi:hypothetical protein WJX79_002154 [Trebouxia sp. C0005]